MSSCTIEASSSGENCERRSLDFKVISNYAASSVSLRVVTLEYNDEIPENMMLKASIKNLKSDAKMKEIKFEGVGTHEEAVSNTAESVIKQNSGEYGSIALVVRRPGCFLCREEALTLTIIAKEHPQLFKGFNLFGVVKEFDVDNEGLLDFHDKYYPFPIYRDLSRTFYKAFGDRKVSIGSTVALINPFSKVMKRIKQKKIKGNLKGAGFLQGGIIFFDSTGRPKYMYEEETGSDLPIEDVVAVLNAMRGG